MKNFKKIFYILNPQERKKASLLVCMILLMAILDMIGIASILPFMTIVTNPGLIETNIFLSKLFKISNNFGVENNQEFLFFVGLIVLLLLFGSLFFKTLTNYAQIRFTQMRSFSISKRLVDGYLHKPYSWSLSNNSSELGKTILSEVGFIVGSGIWEFMQLIAKGSIVISILILLILADPKLALMVGLTICTVYGLIFYLLRNYLSLIGKQRLENNALRFKVVSEAFNANKEVKLAGLEGVFSRRFSDAAKIFAISSSKAEIIRQLPRYLLEAVVFGGVLLIVLYLIGKTGNFNNALPLLSLYVFAGYRLIPALQQAYASFAQIRFVGPSIDKLYKDIKSFEPIFSNKKENILSFKKNIKLKNVNYQYPNSLKPSLQDIELSITAQTKIGIVGSTGSGKTTLVDIILGLLVPQKGILEVDGVEINKENIRSWQKLIGYVPQNIFLSDDTVINNIAFGLDSDHINLQAIEEASKIANLYNFVNDELPQKFDTIIGERGVKLSGGQRQRIGIARALYNKPKILVLDEATSALDNETENTVMQAVNNLDKDITIILIAHRLNTVKNCDIIFQIEKGKIKKKGTYQEVIL